MPEDELFNTAWLFLYAAAEEEIGVEIPDASEGKGTKEQTA